MTSSTYNDSLLDEDSHGFDKKVISIENNDFASTSTYFHQEPGIKLGICKICLDWIYHKDHKFTPADVPVALTCGHIFHGGCLHQWIHKYSKIFTRQRTFNIKKIQPLDDSTCPECRAEITSHVSRLILDTDELSYKNNLEEKIKELEFQNNQLKTINDKNTELLIKNEITPIMPEISKAIFVKSDDYRVPEGEGDLDLQEALIAESNFRTSKHDPKKVQKLLNKRYCLRRSNKLVTMPTLKRSRVSINVNKKKTATNNNKPASSHAQVRSSARLSHQNEQHERPVTTGYYKDDTFECSAHIPSSSRMNLILRHKRRINRPSTRSMRR